MTFASFFKASDFQRFESSAFLNDYSRETVDTPAPLGPLQSQFKRQKTTLADIAKKSQRVPRSWDPLLDHLERHLLHYRAVIPLSSCILQASLLIYLLATYVTLPADPLTGKRPPRVGNLYSIWPFSSCIGSHHLPQYLGLKVTILSLNATSTFLTCYFGRDEVIAWQLCRAVAIFSGIVYAMGMWAVIAAREVDRTLHLFATAAELLSMYTLKGLSFSMDHVTRLRFRKMLRVWQVKVDVWWKAITMGFAFPLGIMTALSIYMCDYVPREDIQTPGRTCYKVMATGAISECFYLITSISWSASVAWDQFTAAAGRAARQRQEEEEREVESPIGNPPSYRSRAPTFQEVSETGEEVKVEMEMEMEVPGRKQTTISVASDWSGLTMVDPAYESVQGFDEGVEDPAEVRLMV